jgi:hypothetical protein
MALGLKKGFSTWKDRIFSPKSTKNERESAATPVKKSKDAVSASFIDPLPLTDDEISIAQTYRGAWLLM